MTSAPERGDEHVSDEAWAAFVSGALDEDAAAAVRAHLASCALCAASRVAIETTMALPESAASLPGAADEALARGSTLGRYLLLDVIGRGGIGLVYAAYDPELDRKVAIKLLRPEGPATDGTDESGASRRRGRLLREAQAMAKLSHPNVLPVYDVGTANGQVFMAVELMEGGTLKRWERLRPRTWREIVAVYIEAGRGLAAAHAAGIVHRDFKPDNVLLGADGRPRVTDFGLARAGVAPPDATLLDRSDVGVSQTEEGALVGTPAYMSPEQFLGEMADARSDQFSFAAALYEALYGQRAFAGDTFGALRHSVLLGKPRDPPAGSAVPGHLRRVLLRALSRDPAARYPDLDELLGELRRDPARARRRGGLAVAALVALAAGVATVVRGARLEARACEAQEAAVGEVWNEGARKAAEQAFLATGLPYAGRAFESTRRALDDYAQQWARRAREACEATRIRREVSPAVLELRLACLETRRRELGALARLLATADASLVERGVAAAEQLKSLEPCDDVAGLTAGVPLPKTAEARARLDALEARVAEARALRSAGRFASALTMTNGLEADAVALAYTPVESEVRYLRGILQQRAGDAEGARTTLRAAYSAAEEARRDELKAEIALGLATSVVNHDSRFEEAQAWLALARSIDRRVGEPPALDAEVAATSCSLALKEARYRDAEADARRAIERAELAHGKGTVGSTEAYRCLGDALKRQGRFEDAYRVLEQVRAVLEAALGPEHPDVGVVYDRETVLFNLADDGARALEHGHKALAILEKALPPGDIAIADALSHVAVANQHLHRVDETITFEQRALTIYEAKYGADSRDAAISYANIAAALNEVKRYDEALAMSRRALALYEQQLPARHPSLAVPLANVATALTGLGRPGEAVPFLERAFELRRADDDPCEAFLAVEALLADALWEGRVARPRARTLMEDARRLAQSCGRSELVGQHEAWLAKHRP